MSFEGAIPKEIAVRGSCVLTNNGNACAVLWSVDFFFQPCTLVDAPYGRASVCFSAVQQVGFLLPEFVQLSDSCARTACAGRPFLLNCLAGIMQCQSVNCTQSRTKGRTANALSIVWTEMLDMTS